MNKNPLWKTLLVLASLVWGVIYAIPNLYPDDYAIQVSGARGAISVTDAELKKAQDALDTAGIAYRQPELGEKGITIRFDSNDVQLKAQPIIKSALGSDYVVALNLVPTTPEWLASMGASPMKLGLDLRGGVHFLLEVDLEKATQQNLEIALSDIKSSLREAKIRYRQVSIVEGGKLELVFRQESERDEALAIARKEFPNYLIEKTSSDKGELVTLQLSEARLREIEDYAVSQNLSTIRNRVNELGVAEPLVQRQGRGRIIVQLPGVQDTAAAKRVLGATANLEFRLEASPDAGVGTTETFKFRSDPRTAVIEKDIIITGSSVAHAAQNFDEHGQPQVNIKLDSAGGKKMYRVTANAVQRRMAVLFVEHKERIRMAQENGQAVEKRDRYVEKSIISLATIQSPLGNDFRITGLDSVPEASELALLLRSGALAAPVYFVEERTVGPSLGQKNIEAGVNSMVIGFVLVLVFMLVFYRFFGFLANIALAANVVILVSIMAMLSATLTLPGIAGIVLTVGMAVDANVLIFERIREELRNGVPVQSAIHAGYDRAFISIFDSNITTLIAAIIMFAIGSGPVKGFAVTLSIGILTSMFTAVVVTRTITNMVYGGRKLDSISIGSIKKGGVVMENRVINFMGIAKPTALLSLLMVLASIVALAVKGLTLGLDFTGGTSLELEFSAAPEIREVRETLASNGFDKAVIQTFGADTAVLVRLQQELTDTLGQDVVNALSGLDSKVKLTKADYVGSQVGEELREDGGLGLLLALLTIMVYVAMRFQFKFSVGAVVALFHDVTITLGGVFDLGWEFDLNVLAAILALIGYSLNDTIVVFDRIRENFRKLRKETPVSIVNISLTDTLSRTIMTGVTTLLVVVALYLFGGEALVGFSKALIIGILIGTYSSVYIASNLALMMNVTSEDLMEPVKEGAQVDDRP